jgi:amino acid transporter
MRARLAGTVMLSTVVFFVVSVVVSVGVLWWSGEVGLGTLIGVICGTVAAAFTFGAVVRAMGRSGNAPATKRGDLGMEMIAEKGMPMRNTMLLLY